MSSRPREYLKIDKFLFSKNFCWTGERRGSRGEVSAWKSNSDTSFYVESRQATVIRCRSRTDSLALAFLVYPFIRPRRIMHAPISIRSNSILVRGRRARRVEFPYRPPADGMEMPDWKTTRGRDWYLAASFSVSCRASRETQTQILRTTALFDEAGASRSRIPRKQFYSDGGLYRWGGSSPLNVGKKAWLSSKLVSVVGIRGIRGGN